MLHIRKMLHAVLSVSPPAQEVREFVQLCHQIATINLQSRVARGGLRLDLLGLSVSDLALDCIAPLFTRDKDNRFPKLLRYFRDVDVESASEALLLARLRPLIFGIAQQELSRIYQAADPSLARILENLRYAIGLAPEFTVEERFGHAWIVLREHGGKEQPAMPGEFLEAHLSVRLMRGGSFREVLRALHGILAENPSYFPGYPLVDFAIRIRMCVVRSHAEGESETTHDPHAISADEIADAIEQVTAFLEKEYRPSYLDKGAMDPVMVDALVRAVGAILKAEYLDGHGEERAFYDHLHALVPTLDVEGYRTTYRSRLEYLVKLGRQQLLRTLRTELL